MAISATAARMTGFGVGVDVGVEVGVFVAGMGVNVAVEVFVAVEVTDAGMVADGCGIGAATVQPTRKKIITAMPIDFCMN